jgi:hypothetical protein
MTLIYFENNQKIFTKTAGTYNRKIKKLFGKIGLPVEDYSSHSFLRGGAYNAAKQGVPDSVIKVHGRWRRESYQKYVPGDFNRAGETISSVI